MDVARSAPQGAHCYHADVINLLTRLGIKKGARGLWYNLYTSLVACSCLTFEFRTGTHGEGGGVIRDTTVQTHKSAKSQNHMVMQNLAEHVHHAPLQWVLYIKTRKTFPHWRQTTTKVPF